MSLNTYPDNPNLKQVRHLVRINARASKNAYNHGAQITDIHDVDNQRDAAPLISNSTTR